MGAVTGLQNLAGYPDRDPAGTGTNYPDHVPNPTHAAFAVLAAIRHHRRTGVGQLIDLAQIEPTIALLGASVLDFTCNGRVSERVGNQHIAAAPCGVYPCAGVDRWIAIVADSDATWCSLTQAIEATALAGDARFATGLARWRHRRELDALLGQITAAWDGKTLMQRLQEKGVAAGVVNDAADMLRIDQQMAYREHWAYLDHLEMGRTAYGSMPFRFSNADVVPRSAAPLLGQHSDEIGQQRLGLTQADIRQLRAEGVLS
jgi:benzylsuccinate CoA-transferase BbsF subunit